MTIDRLVLAVEITVFNRIHIIVVIIIIIIMIIIIIQKRPLNTTYIVYI